MYESQERGQDYRQSQRNETKNTQLRKQKRFLHYFKNKQYNTDCFSFLAQTSHNLM